MDHPHDHDEHRHDEQDGHGHGHDHSSHGHDEHGDSGHSHGVSADADRRWLSLALGLIATFMAGEVVVGLIAKSLALLSDAAHMLTDAGAIVLALVAMRLAARPPKGGFASGVMRKYKRLRRARSLPAPAVRSQGARPDSRVALPNVIAEALRNTEPRTATGPRHGRGPQQCRPA